MTRFNLEAKDIINLELKLDGKLPVDRDELLALASSWGRNESFYTKDKNNKAMQILKQKKSKKYDLSKLDVSEILNFDDIFAQSNFNGDINSWDVSNGTSMDWMFFSTKNFNSPLDKWNTSNITSMYHTFYNSLSFNQNLNSWDISKVTDMCFIFCYTKEFNQPVLWDLSNIKSCSNMFGYIENFKNKFNKGKDLPINTNDIKVWLKKNRDRMIAIDIEENKSKELDNFLLNINKDIKRLI